MSKSGIGQSAFVGAGHDQPLVIVPHLGRRQHQLTIGIGELGEIGCQDLPLRLSGGHLLLAPAEKFDIGLGDRLAGHSVRHEVQRLAVEWLANQSRIRQPDDHPADIAVLHCSGDQVGSRLLQRRRDLYQAVVVGGFRLQIQRPGRDFLTQVLGLILNNQVVSHVLDIRSLPVELPRS